MYTLFSSDTLEGMGLACSMEGMGADYQQPQTPTKRKLRPKGPVVMREEATDPLELGLQMVLRHCVGAGN